MSTYYTQEQLDSIGVLIANKIASNGEELKQFVQDKIDALEPVAPPAPTEPEAGGGTAPAPAAGTFLDDGREIKSKYFELNRNTNDSITLVSHGLDINNVISVNVASVNLGASQGVSNIFQSNPDTSNANSFTYFLRPADVVVQHARLASMDRFRVLITYLA